jgi:hypothetical protein
MKKKIVLTLIAATFFASGASAAVGTAKALIKVLAQVNVNRDSDLIFDDAQVGSPEQTVLPGTADNDKNASFTIVGEPNRQVAIVLPADDTVVMKKGTGGTPETEIAVNGFDSNFPTLTAQIGATGTVALYVGATRAALLPNQESGNYEADFQVDVTYQ